MNMQIYSVKYSKNYANQYNKSSLHIKKKIRLQSKRSVYPEFRKDALNFAFSFLRNVILDG